MPSATFVGEVRQGQLSVPLAEFEGMRVTVTLTPAEDGAAEVRAGPSPRADEEAEILEDCGRLRMPRRDVKTVTILINDVGRRKPRVYAEDECEVGDD